ncbi:MAG TPA: hypothetical protein VKZ51_13615 [Cyclobacteriaceae bacterium]|nr:hypothetical protein [Cyclobacteriaceae bacterium]
MFIRVPYSGEAEIPASPYFFIGECASPTGWRGISGSVAWGDAPCSGVSGFQPDDRPGECAEFDNEFIRSGILKGRYSIGEEKVYLEVRQHCPRFWCCQTLSLMISGDML